jgi:hypothetical protein
MHPVRFDNRQRWDFRRCVWKHVMVIHNVLERWLSLLRLLFNVFTPAHKYGQRVFALNYSD